MSPRNLTNGTDEASRLILHYRRVSNGQQDLERQRAAIQRIEADNPGREIRVIEDDGVSAYQVPIFDRAGGQELCDLIAAGRVEKLYTDAQDRLSRGEDVEWVTFQSLCETNETTILIDFVESRFDDGGKTMSYLRALDARRESREKSHRVRSGKRALCAAGYWPHGKVPIGFVPVPAPDNPMRKILEHDPDATSAIREAHRRFDEDHASHRDVIQYLNEQLGLNLSRHTARDFLSNPAYIGKVKCGHELFDGRHEALISCERFERNQRRLERAAIEHHKPPKKWPFARIARCPTCGYALRFRVKTKENNKRYPYLLCQNDKCDQSSLPAALFEANFAFYLGAIAHGLRKRLATDARFAITESSEGTLADAEEEARQTEARLADATSLILDGALTRDDPRYQRALAARNAAQASVDRLSSRARSYRDELAEFTQSVSSLADFAHDDPDAHRPFEETLTIIGKNGYAHSLTVDHNGDGPTLLQILSGWRLAPLERKRAIVERTFSRITATADSLELHFHTALPEGLSLPILFPPDNRSERAELETEGFGDLAGSVPLTETTPR